MTLIARRSLETGAGWADIATLIADWAQAQAIDLRELVVLVPFAQLLVPARKAFALRGGWQPRVETTRTLAASLGPAPRGGDAPVTLDAAVDRLHAARLLRGQSWVSREPLVFDDAVSAVVTTAHTLLKASAAVAPGARGVHWQRGRDLLAAGAGVGGIERGLARVALEWAASTPGLATDALFDLRPGAWVAVQAGGADPLVDGLLAAMPDGWPRLVVDADAHAHLALASSLTLARCDGFEHEAQCAAAQVLAHLQRGEAPVALVAQDRLLMRRMRALLERHGVGLQDETGWTLSTTRAAAQVMALLRAAAPQASTDLLLDWLKATAWPPGAVAGLEAACRRHGWTRASAIPADETLRGAAADLLAAALPLLDGLAVTRRRPLADWLVALRTALADCGMLPRLAADAAGIEVLEVLHIVDAEPWAAQAAQATMTLADFTQWVDAALEDASFVPEAAPQASVVVTPLARLMLRPFAAVVFPGADDHHLGVESGPHPLLSDAQAQALGVPTARERRQAEALAFAHAVGQAPVSFFHRHADGAEPLAPSALVEQLGLRLASVGRSFAPWVDPRTSQDIVPTPVTMPAPAAAALLPERLSASACEALRACPYRFHALYLLRLREAEELGDEVKQRDYGNWLHDVLLQFHTQRAAPGPADVEVARLLAIAQAEKQRQGLDDADFLPFEAGFIDLVPRYIAWLHERDAQGAQFWQGEQDREVAPPEWAGTRLHGRIDRMDRVHTPAGTAIELIDYKTGSQQRLREKVEQPLEDTQLAFYAALVQPEHELPIQASYLALGREIKVVVHHDVEDSARALVHGVGDDLARLRRGAGLPALGEPPTCDYCEARGLCRRDHWSGA